MTQTEVDKMTQWICLRFPHCGRGGDMVHAMTDVIRLLGGLPLAMVEESLTERAATKNGKWGTSPRWICHELRAIRERLVEQRQEQDTPYPMWPLSLPWPEGTIIIRDEDYEQARVIRHVKAQIREKDAVAHALEGPSLVMGEIRWRRAWSFKRVWHRSYVMEAEDRDRMKSLAPDEVEMVRLRWKDWSKAGDMVPEGGGWDMGLAKLWG